MKSPRPDPLCAPDEEEDESGLQPIHEAWDEVYEQMRRAFKARDYGRAVDLGVRFTQRHPSHISSTLFVQECRTLLECQLEKQLAPLDRAVVLWRPLESARLDPGSAFILSQVDGRTTIEDLVDLAPMPRADALRIIASAIDNAIISIVD